MTGYLIINKTGIVMGHAETNRSAVATAAILGMQYEGQSFSVVCMVAR